LLEIKRDESFILLIESIDDLDNYFEGLKQELINKKEELKERIKII
jgi:hypothetical protein